MAALFRHAIAQPLLYAFLWPDKRYFLLHILQYSRSVERINVVIVIVRGQHRIHICHRKGVKDDGRRTKVGLSHTATGHISHLMERVHFLFLLGPLSIAKPEINGNVRVAFRLDPQAGTANPPHGNCAGLNDLSVNLFIEPSTPLRKCTQNPGLSCDFVNFRHIRASFSFA